MCLDACIVRVIIYLQLFLSVFLQSLFKPVCFGLKRLILEGEGVYLVLGGETQQLTHQLCYQPSYIHTGQSAL